MSSLGCWICDTHFKVNKTRLKQDLQYELNCEVLYYDEKVGKASL